MNKVFDTIEMRDFIAGSLPYFVRIPWRESRMEDWCSENVGKKASYTHDGILFKLDTSQEFDWGVVCFADDGGNYRIYFKDDKCAVQFKLRFG